MKTGKVKDANNNNIPDAIEEKVEAVKEAVAEVKEIVEKATKSSKTPAANKPVAKTTAKKAK
jgi:archaellum component FlaC